MRKRKKRITAKSGAMMTAVVAVIAVVVGAVGVAGGMAIRLVMPPRMPTPGMRPAKTPLVMRVKTAPSGRIVKIGMARAVAAVAAVAGVVAGRKMGGSPLSRALNRKKVQTQTPQLTLHPLMPVQRMRRSGLVVARQRHRPPKLLKLQPLSPRAWMKSQNACAAKRQMMR
jgi:hypothetical protein